MQRRLPSSPQNPLIPPGLMQIFKMVNQRRDHYEKRTAAGQSGAIASTAPEGANAAAITEGVLQVRMGMVGACWHGMCARVVRACRIWRD